MKHLLIRFQIIFVSAILLATMVMMMGLVTRYNSRWDFTREKLFSLSDSTRRLLEKLASDKIEVLAFYPHDDANRKKFESFLKEAQLHHSGLKYGFYDPDRVPSLAKKFNVKDFYNVILIQGKRKEKMASPSEESFVNALLRLAQPKRFGICFPIGHGEASLGSEERPGLKLFAQSLTESNDDLHEIILARDGIPPVCEVVVVAGPHRDFDAEEFGVLKKAFREGKGIFFTIDPMDPGAGKSFRDFMKEFGILLGEDVIVDKMSRLAGGDFLVPLVSQYVEGHPITENFERPSFFPVARSVQPSTEPAKEIEVVPLALTSSGSWAETNLALLEKGEASFDRQGDLMGPVPIAVAAEMLPAGSDRNTEEKKSPQPEGAQSPKQNQGRMVVVGDSDFITNAYFSLSGNSDLALNIIRWLTQDDRFLSIHPRKPEFKPLFITSRKRGMILFVTLAVLPLSFLFLGSAGVLSRKKAA